MGPEVLEVGKTLCTEAEGCRHRQMFEVARELTIQCATAQVRDLCKRLIERFNARALVVLAGCAVCVDLKQREQPEGKRRNCDDEQSYAFLQRLGRLCFERLDRAGVVAVAHESIASGSAKCLREAEFGSFANLYGHWRHTRLVF